MADRICAQCGKPVVVGVQHVVGEVTDPDGSVRLDIEHLHYDCLKVSLRDTDPYITAATAAAQGGLKDSDLQAHLEANVMGKVS